MAEQLSPKISVYPGSFDPITNGHVDVVSRAIKIFDQVIVSVIENPDKKPTFSIADRLAMVKAAVKPLGPSVKVGSFRGLLVDYVKQVKACAILRGLRAVSDFDYEFQMALTNYRMVPEVATLFLMTDAAFSYLSSSLVRQIARLGGDISGFVPRTVAERLRRKFKSKQRR